MPAGNTVEMSIPKPFTIESLKQVISKKKGIYPLCQRITFNGRVLEDGHELMEYNIQIGSTLDLVVNGGSKYIYCVFCGTCCDLPTHNLPVLIQTPKGDSFLETQSSYTIGQVKTMIQEKLGVSTEELKWYLLINCLKMDAH